MQFPLGAVAEHAVDSIRTRRRIDAGREPHVGLELPEHALGIGRVRTVPEEPEVVGGDVQRSCALA